MIQRRRRASLLFKSSQSIVVSGERSGQELQRHFATESLVFGEINLAHAAATDKRDDFVRSDRLTGVQFHRLADQQRSRSFERRMVDKAPALFVRRDQ